MAQQVSGDARKNVEAGLRICFFANMRNHANWREMFQKIEFYRVDIQLLQELGHEVHLAGSPRHLDPRADLYYTWWWGHAPFPLLLGSFRRRPVVVTGAFDYSTCRQEIPGMCYLDRPAWQKAVLRASLRLCDANLFISGSEFNEVTAHLPVRNPVLAPLAVDTAFYRVDEQAPRGNFFFTVCWTSRANVIRKGVDRAIRAFARVHAAHPDLRLLVAGKDGDGLADLKALAGELGVAEAVDFVGFIPDEEKASLYRRCLAYLQPSLHEGFGLAAAEALASGAHVISSDRGSLPEVVGPHGICVDPLDIDALAREMQRTAQLPNPPERQKAAADWIASNYSHQKRKECLSGVLGKFQRH